VRDYRAIESAAAGAAKPRLRALEAALRTLPRPSSATASKKTSIRGSNRHQ
jgi:hypothetical protein